MSFFDDASLAFLPSGAAGKDGKAYSIKPTDGTGDFTFSRGSNLAATRVGADGLIEKGRENLLLQSNQFDTTWNVLNAPTLTSGQTGYDGSSDAWLFESTTSSTAVINQNVSSSGVQTISLYAKAGTADYLVFYNSAANYAFFNLSSGSVGSTSGIIDTSIESIGSGWYRCSMTYTASISYMRIYVADANAVFNSAIGSNIYIQDAQLEIGLAATDYIESGATTGKAGLLEDEPRFDYSGGATCPSLLLEPSRSNLITQSEYITGTIRATITHNQAISPEGLQNAALAVDSTDANNHQCGGGLANLGGTDTAVYSIFAKKQNNRYINLRIIDDAASAGTGINFYNATFDLEGGVVTDDFESGTPTNPFSDIEDYGNGWFRCWVGLTKKSGVARTDYSVYLVNSSAAGANPTYAGTGNDGNYLYGLQLEQGSYPTSYIPNHSGGSVTRGADVSTIFNQSGVIGQTEGTIFLDAYFNETDRVNFSISDSTSSNYVTIETTSGKQLFGVVRQGGSTQTTISTSPAFFTEGDRLKCAIAYNANDFAFYINGTQIGTDSSGSVPACDDIRFSRYNGSLAAAQKVNKTLLFDTRLSNTDLATLTTI